MQGRAADRVQRRFPPAPQDLYANAAPSGAASEAEYAEIGLTARCDPEDVRARLDAALPAGLDIVEVVEATPGALADRLDTSVWRIAVPGFPQLRSPRPSLPSPPPRACPPCAP